MSSRVSVWTILFTAGLLPFWLGAPILDAAGTTTDRVTFANSLAPAPEVSSAKTSASGGIVADSVGALSAAQLAEPLEFSVAMGMRNLGEFQSRIASGELVSYEEVQASYLPLQSDYDRVVAWLKSEGFTFTFNDTSRLSIFVQGTPAQIQKSFGLTMQSVTVNGTAYAAAVTAPSLPAEVSSGVLGVNGLQPYHQKRTYHKSPTSVKTGGMEPRSLTTPDAPPYLISEILNA